MDKSDERYGCYVAILEEELVCAMGCTEPIAIAYAAARARAAAGGAAGPPGRLGVRQHHQEREERGRAPYGRTQAVSRPLQRQASWQGGPNASWK